MSNLTSIDEKAFANCNNSEKVINLRKFFGGTFKMAVKMRLKRMGKKRHPIYRIVVADSRAPRDGRFIEEIGTYDPNYDPCKLNIDAELAKKWLANGAQPTEQVGKIFKAAGIVK